MIEHEGELKGIMNLEMKKDNIAEIGYWVGRRHWGKGLATEAAKLIVREGFKKLKLHKIYATHHPKNIASGRVMQKLGMKYEGTLRQHVKSRGKYRDMVHYCILRSEFL